MNSPGQQVPNMLLEIRGEITPERMKREMEPKQKQHLVVDVTGDEFCIQNQIKFRMSFGIELCQRLLKAQVTSVCLFYFFPYYTFSSHYPFLPRNSSGLETSNWPGLRNRVSVREPQTGKETLRLKLTGNRAQTQRGEVTCPGLPDRGAPESRVKDKTSDSWPTACSTAPHPPVWFLPATVSGHSSSEILLDHTIPLLTIPYRMVP